MAFFGESPARLIKPRCVRAQATKGRGAPLVNLWRVQRKGDDARFAKHQKLDNRRLLFHGTRVPVCTWVYLDVE